MFFEFLFDSAMHIKGRGVPLKILSRRELCRRIKQRYYDQMAKLKERIAHINYFGTTADVWTSGARRAMGLTLHWVGGIYFEFI